MQDFAGRVAVVTGAASGIGLALCERFVGLGMKVVMADIEAPRLAAQVSRLSDAGAEVNGVVTDVSDADAVDALADATWGAFGAAHLLCNNAGVITGGSVVETPLADWDWVLGVNFYGVLHGVRSFLSRMQEQQGPGHIVNVASMAGVTTLPFVSTYHVSKHAVVALSECLYKELAAAQSPIGVSLLCPELVDTEIAAAARHRPKRFSAAANDSATKKMILETTGASTRTGVPPAEMAARVEAAIRAERFYVLSEDAVWRPLAEQRCDDVKAARNPGLAMPEAPA